MTTTFELPAARSPEHQAALTKLFERIGELSQLPLLSSRLLAIATEDDSMVDDLLVIVSSDPPTAARTLRRVNASGLAATPLPSLSQAITQLGVHEVWNAAFTASLFPLFAAGDSPAKASGYNREELWHYSLAMAKASALIASHCQQLSRPVAYATGMLHHIGYFLLDQNLKHHYLRFLAVAKHRAKKALRVTELEETIFTFHHASLGGFAAAKWNLPPEVCEAIEFHHHFERYQGDHPSLLATLVLAGKLCADLGCQPLGLPGDSPNLHSVFAALKLPPHALDHIRTQLAGEMQPGGSR